jgi:RimJ/RimL family protein N-acetyltransferase
MIAPTLTTDRLTLRAARHVDFEDYAAQWADPEITRYIGGTPRDRNTSWNKFLMGAGLWPVLGYGFWTIADRETDRYLGNAGLAQFERGVESLVGHVEAGWALYANAWGKGLATEAMQAILAWGDANLAAHEIRCIIDHDNPASHSVARKCGFEIVIPVIPEFPESALWRRGLG